jgi:hypothetical protein
MRRLAPTGVLVTLLVLASCATTYQPLQVDPRTSQYATSVQVDPGGIETFVTTSDPKSFPVVLLLTDASYRPALFSFMVRDAMAQAGVTGVYTAEEFRAMAEDRRHPAPDRLGSDYIKDFSSSVAPVLVVSATHNNVGGANTLTTLSVQDGRTGKVLLKMNHTRLVWMSFDTEAIYPVLNKFREWVKASTPGAA